ncbi:MAG: hypothetical protein HY645_13390 [Acidobacteria bacterium]|nr:hypothetical protein [Acidobacteriota bacterium]
MRTLKEYRVVWEIELYACSPREAAQRALETQRDPDSTATGFDVYRLDAGTGVQSATGEPVHVDLGRYHPLE